MQIERRKSSLLEFYAEMQLILYKDTRCFSDNGKYKIFFLLLHA